jgi:MoxR-like ATPase
MAAKASAFLNEREYALPEDLQQVLPWVVGHRLRSKDEGLEFSRDKLTSLLMEVPVP